ncbi:MULTISPECIES: lipoprotein 17-related variable surface protein [unclassified Mycoplasma]|uniref:lipoprotein 17-related variable surface protein n=1 Tax=unclassified Mycoplasma TaxID=2683645 RepID=UPI000FDF27DC
MIDRKSLKKYQKYLLSLAALTTVTVPVATIIHFGTDGFGANKTKDPDQEQELKVLELKDVYQTKLTDKTTLDFEIGQNLTVNQLGLVGQISLGKQKVKLQVVEIDDESGQLQVHLLDAQTSRKIVNKVILVAGFLTSTKSDILNHLIRKIKSVYQTSLTNQSINEHQIVVGRFATLEQLGLDTKIIFNLRGAEVAYIVLSVNQRLGKVKIRAELKFKGEERSKDLQVVGFLPAPTK